MTLPTRQPVQRQDNHTNGLNRRADLDPCRLLNLSRQRGPCGWLGRALSVGLLLGLLSVSAAASPRRGPAPKPAKATAAGVKKASGSSTVRRAGAHAKKPRAPKRRVLPKVKLTAGPVGKLEGIVDPSGRALDAWRAALLRTMDKPGRATAMFFGASHTAADLWTGELRRRWQGRYGEGGHGFVLPSKWNPGYRAQDLVVDASPGWQVLRHMRDQGPAVGDFGLLGVAMTSENPEDFAGIRTTRDNALGRRFDHLELWLRPQPGGGDLRVDIDGRVQVVHSGPQAQSRVIWELADRAHSVRIQPAGNGPVVVYGLVAERKSGGVVLDQLGIPGMRAEILLHWAESTWAEQVSRRQPDLIVLAYGTNALTEDDETLEHYQQDWERVLAQVHRAAPGASCLVVGPTDRLVGQGAKRAPAPRTQAIIDVQVQIATAAGCAHWDGVAAMGGLGSMAKWQAAKLAQRDGVHLNREGYYRFAELMDAALSSAMEGK